MGIIVHNMQAMTAQRVYKINTDKRGKASERLSSGFRINRAADDAAGLTISEGMRAQIRGLDQGARNVQDGISLVHVADGALQEVQEMLQRMTELSVQAANDTYTAEDRQKIQDEISQLILEIDRIGNDTEFNTLKVFDLEPRNVEIKVGQLLTSPSSATGYMTEAAKIGNRYFPSSSLDFSGITEKNVDRLVGKSFSFACSQACPETFKFSFISKDGNGSYVVGQNNGNNPHTYYIDIAGATSGAEVLDRLYSYISNNMPNNYLPASDSLAVSHSNRLYKSGSRLQIAATSPGYNTADGAKRHFAHATGPYGKVDFSEVSGNYTETKETRSLTIQCGANSEQVIELEMFKMNAEVIGVEDMDVTTQESASASITKAHTANEMISTMRSCFGAYENRLEHSYNNNLNQSENLSYAESEIRDANMADEMVEFSKQSILMQAGEAMIAQANQSKEGFLTLLK